MKLGILLWLLAVRFKRSIHRNPSMREYLQDVELTIQFTTGQHNVARYLAFRDQRLRSRNQELEDADLMLRFKSPAVGFNILWAMATGKDRNAVMRAIQDRNLVVEGDPRLLMWFQKSIKHLH